MYAWYRSHGLGSSLDDADIGPRAPSQGPGLAPNRLVLLLLVPVRTAMAHMLNVACSTAATPLYPCRGCSCFPVKL